jgi:hypothetical protein
VSAFAEGAAKIITSGWCPTAAKTNATGDVLRCDVDPDAARGDMLPALARLCLKIARRRVASQKAEPADNAKS